MWMKLTLPLLLLSACAPQLSQDAGREEDAGPEAAEDAGPEAAEDAGPEAAEDAGPEAGEDAGLPQCSEALELPDPFRYWKLHQARDAGTECVKVGWNVECRGVAQHSSEDGGLTLSFADGSTLRWIGPEADRPQLPASVQLELDDHERYPHVGSPLVWTHRVIIRDVAGATLFASAAGREAQSPADVLAIFGVPALPPRARCEASLSTPCERFIRTSFDLSLNTMPPTTIPGGKTTDIQSPTGNWRVLWIYGEERQIEFLGSDCGPIASSTAYMFSRVQ